MHFESSTKRHQSDCNGREVIETKCDFGNNASLNQFEKAADQRTGTVIVIIDLRTN